MLKTFALLFFVLSAIATNAQDSLTQYTGKYVFPAGSVVPEMEITIENGVLKTNSTSGSSTLVQLGVDSFSIVEYNGTAVFKRNAENKVNAVHIDVMGLILDGKKQENAVWLFTSWYLPAKGELIMPK